LTSATGAMARATGSDAIKGKSHYYLIREGYFAGYGNPALRLLRRSDRLSSARSVRRDGQRSGTGRSFVPNGSAACPGQPVALTGADVDKGACLPG
jgi:hypothetical protein